MQTQGGAAARPCKTRLQGFSWHSRVVGGCTLQRSPTMNSPRLLATVTVACGVLASPLGAAERAPRILAIGDSLTEANPGYRSFLYEKLRDGGYSFEMVGPKKQKAPDGGQLDHAGSGGFTIGPGPSKADEWTNGKGNISVNVERYLESNPDIVLLLIGTNEFFNIGKLQPDLKADRDGPVRLAALVDRIHEFRPEAKILVGSVMPVEWDAGFAKGFNSALPGLLADKPNTIFVDTNKLANFTTGDWSGDKLHPSESGHRKLAGVWFEALKPLLPANPQAAASPNEPEVPPSAEAEGVRGQATVLWDFVGKGPSYGYGSWDPLTESGTATDEGWQVVAAPNGGVGLALPSPVSLEGYTHLALKIRKDGGGNCDVFVKTVSETGDKLYRVPSADMNSEVTEILIPLEGNPKEVKQLQIQGNFNMSQKFAYTLVSLEAVEIKK